MRTVIKPLFNILAKIFYGNETLKNIDIGNTQPNFIAYNPFLDTMQKYADLSEQDIGNIIHGMVKIMVGTPIFIVQEYLSIFSDHLGVGASSVDTHTIDGVFSRSLINKFLNQNAVDDNKRYSIINIL